MPGNIAPIYSKVAHWQWSTGISAANTALDGIGTSYIVFTADPNNGGYVKKLRIKPIAANSIATVMRIFINNGSPTSTAANNVLYDEIALGTNVLTQSSAFPFYEVPINEALPPNYQIFVTLGTATSGAGYAVTVVAGKY